MARQTTVIFVAQTPAEATNGAQPTLPPCRAFRIIPLRALDCDATSAVVIAGVVPAAPASTVDGALPVWVKATNPTTNQEIPGVKYIHHDGWHNQPMGKNWRIEFVGSGTVSGGRFAYAIETVDDLDDAGQVNAQRTTQRVELFTTPPTNPVGYVLRLMPRPGETKLGVWVDTPKNGGVAPGGRLYPLRPNGSRGLPWQDATQLVAYCIVAAPALSHAQFPWLVCGRDAGTTQDTPNHADVFAAGQPAIRSWLLNPYGYEFEFTQGNYEATEACTFAVVWERPC